MQDAASDSEYEYEYDENETDTFYVNIDLTSYNGPLRPSRGQPFGATDQVGRDDQEVDDTASPVEERDRNRRGRENIDADVDVDVEHEHEPEPEPDEDYNNDDRIQIMELHSRNPFVSYRGHIFSCEWADMIGTDMHFVSRKDSDSDPDPTYVKHADDYSLVATNGIKIIGRRAQFRARPANNNNNNNNSTQTNESNQTETSSSEPNLILPQQQQQQHQEENKSAQVRFLQELMDIKREKGETDMMRMAYGTKRGQNFEDRIRGWAHTDERAEMIHQLGRAALGGDQNALARLEELYNRIDGNNHGNNGGVALNNSDSVADTTADTTAG